MDRALPAAALVGLAAGTVVTQVLDAGWYLALGTAPLYAGWSYFAISYPAALSASVYSFGRRRDKLGYAAGVFGISVTPLAIGDAAGSGTVAFAPVVAAFGILGFLYTLGAVLAVEPGVVTVEP
ncbi:hypothetical protein ACFQL1_11460 [Halomicroarcula sp. GCM10025709]|uniref:hypothetical protein n=1 Tax=Haloarcula TaxID=2237 RepID=UPI0024C24CE3|nr:hypothetical protein [Halomicroarcula sp. YJ-61-S]